MKLNKNFLVNKTGNDTVIIPTGNAECSGVVRENKIFGVILDWLKRNITEQQNIYKMTEKYDAPYSEIEKNVFSIIIGMRKIGAIDG